MSLREFNNNLPEEVHKFNHLHSILERLKEKYALTPVFGAEIEFYLYPPDERELNITEMSRLFNLKLKNEKGRNQFEINITPHNNLHKFVQEVTDKRQNIKNIASTANLTADFTSKPNLNEYGSAMHIHLSFEEDGNAEKYANILCNYIKITRDFFIPGIDERKRLDNRFMAPTHISWGGNNRTCLIRIPDSLPRRIEHRLAGANIDPIYPIYAILSSVLDGLENSKLLKDHPKTYGNAYDQQYNLEKIED